MEEIVQLINKYGFPIVAACGMGYFIYYVWKWVTTEIKPVLGKAFGTLVALIDRVRMLDNDMIRLTTKLNVILEQKEREKSDESSSKKRSRN
jgi:hypothetical protein